MSGYYGWEAGEGSVPRLRLGYIGTSEGRDIGTPAP